MAKGCFSNSIIRGIACAVPKRVVYTTDYYNEFGQDIVDKFIKVVGIKQRHIAKTEQTTADLCYVAAEQLLRAIGWERDSVDAIILATQTPDYDAPSSACVLQYRLRLSWNCMAFDMNLGCSNYVYGMFVVTSLLQNTDIKRVLFLSGETSNMDDHDQATAMMFGDAGTATAIEKKTGESRFLLKTDGQRYDKIISPMSAWRHRGKRAESDGKPCGKMDGPAVIDFTLFDVPDTFREFFEIYGTSIEAYDYCILHQSNLMAMKQMARIVKIPTAKLATAIDRYGNTSGSSIPLTIVDLCSQLSDKKMLKLLLCGYGIGLSWGVMDVNLDLKESVVLPMIYTDDYFHDAY